MKTILKRCFNEMDCNTRVLLHVLVFLILLKGNFSFGHLHLSSKVWPSTNIQDSDLGNNYNDQKQRTFNNEVKGIPTHNSNGLSASFSMSNARTYSFLNQNSPKRQAKTVSARALFSGKDHLHKTGYKITYIQKKDTEVDELKRKNKIPNNFNEQDQFLFKRQKNSIPSERKTHQQNLDSFHGNRNREKNAINRYTKSIPYQRVEILDKSNNLNLNTNDHNRKPSVLTRSGSHLINDGTRDSYLFKSFQKNRPLPKSNQKDLETKFNDNPGAKRFNLFPNEIRKETGKFVEKVTVSSTNSHRTNQQLANGIPGNRQNKLLNTKPFIRNEFHKLTPDPFGKSSRSFETGSVMAQRSRERSPDGNIPRYITKILPQNGSKMKTAYEGQPRSQNRAFETNNSNSRHTVDNFKYNSFNRYNNMKNDLAETRQNSPHNSKTHIEGQIFNTGNTNQLVPALNKNSRDQNHGLSGYKQEGKMIHFENGDKYHGLQQIITVDNISQELNKNKEQFGNNGINNQKWSHDVRPSEYMYVAKHYTKTNDSPNKLLTSSELFASNLHSHLLSSGGVNSAPKTSIMVQASHQSVPKKETKYDQNILKWLASNQKNKQSKPKIKHRAQNTIISEIKLKPYLDIYSKAKYTVKKPNLQQKKFTSNIYSFIKKTNKKAMKETPKEQSTQPSPPKEKSVPVDVAKNIAQGTKQTSTFEWVDPPSNSQSINPEITNTHTTITPIQEIVQGNVQGWNQNEWNVNNDDSDED